MSHPQKHTPTSPSASTDEELDEAAQGRTATGLDADADTDVGEIDEIGEAAGIPLPSGAVLGGADPIAKRDAHRWELDPASAEEAGEA